MKTLLTAGFLAAAMPLYAQYPQGSGPEPAIAYSDSGLPTHTIYRPEGLEGNYPVVLWGNGSCVNSNFNYREFLSEVASQGFIVLANGPFRASPAPRLQRSEDPALWPPFETRASQMLDALNWITAEGARTDSPFAGHVDMSQVAVMGHSCGGAQAMNVSLDSRITTTLILNSGLFPEGDQYNMRHEVDRSWLTRLHAPIAYFIGGETDIAYVNAESDWADLQQEDVPVINANMDVGHGATYNRPGGYPFASGPIAWLKYQLKGDPVAASLFEGEDCGLCNSQTWDLKRHNIP